MATEKPDKPTKPGKIGKDETIGRSEVRIVAGSLRGR